MALKRFAAGDRQPGPLPPPAPGAPPLRPSQLLARFFVPALMFLVAGALVALLNLLAGPDRAGWISLHLVLLGGVSQLILGAAQFFACAFLATDPPSRKLISAQMLCWNSGVLLVVVGIPSDLPVLTGCGGLLLLVGLGLFAAGLLEMRHRSIQSRGWAVRWYLTAAAFLGVGAVIGVLLGEGRSSDYVNLFGAHQAINIFGWIGMAIVGTLHTFFPSLAGTRLPYPRLEAVTYALWSAGVALLAAGMLAGSDAVAALGWLLLVTAAGVLVVNLSLCLRGRTEASAPAGLPLRLIASGQVFLLAALLLGLVSTLADGPFAALTGDVRQAMSVLLLAGWFGLTVSGSLLHLLALLARVSSGFQVAAADPQPGRDSLIAAAAAGGLGLSALAAVPGFEAAGVAGAIFILAAAVPVVLMLARSVGAMLKVGRPPSGSV